MTEQMSKQYRNSEAKFASPEDDVGIGYYFDGEPVSPEEFSRRVSKRSKDMKAGRAEDEDE